MNIPDETVTAIRAILGIYASNEAYSKHIGHDAEIDYVPAAEGLALLDEAAKPK